MGANNHPLLSVEATINFDYLLELLLGKSFSDFCLQKNCCFLLYKDLSEEHRARGVLWLVVKLSSNNDFWQFV